MLTYWFAGDETVLPPGPPAVSDIRYVSDLVGNVWKSHKTGQVVGGGTAIDRNSLVYGTYEPTAATTGLLTPESSLSDYNASSVNAVTIPANAVISNKIIYGDVSFAGAATLTNCLLVGGANIISLNGSSTTTTGIVKRNQTSTLTGIVKFYDCRFRPRQESEGRDCIIGRQFELYRCHLTGGVDGVGIYAWSGNPWVCDVKVKGCLIEDLTYAFPDAYHDDGTHNDCIQIQGGDNIEIVGNALKGTAHKLAGTGTIDYAYTVANGMPSWKATEWMFTTTPRWMSPLGWNPGSGIIIQDNVGAGAFNSTTIITDNYFRGCKIAMNVKSTATGAWVFQRNKFSKVQAPALNSNPPPTQNPVWISFDLMSAMGTITGLTSSGALANTTNTWLDSATAGQALTEPRANGVLADA
jgi:hypothetical protein